MLMRRKDWKKWTTCILVFFVLFSSIVTPSYSHAKDQHSDDITSIWSELAASLDGSFDDAITVTEDVYPTAQTESSIDTLEKISAARTGSPPSGSSLFPSVSGDGRYVAFASTNSELVEEKTTSFSDIFVYDRALDRMKRINLSPAGEEADYHSYAPVISMDGRHILFTSEARNLLPGAMESAVPRLYLYSSDTGSIQLVADGLIYIKDNNSREEISYAISANGRFAAYSAKTPNGDPDDVNGKIDVFVADMMLNTTERITTGQSWREDAAKVSISSDGRFIAFETMQGDFNSKSQIAVVDRISKEMELVSVSADGEHGNNDSSRASISPDGQFVAFVSRATNLASGVDGSRWLLYLHDRSSGTTQLIPVDGTNISSVSPMYAPSLSAGGEYVLFHANNENGKSQVYAHQRSTGLTWRVSESEAGSEGNQDSRFAGVTADGAYAVFHSGASNLLTEPEGDSYVDIFMKQLPAGSRGLSPAWPADAAAEVVQAGATYAVLSWPAADAASQYRITQDGAHIVDIASSNRTLISELEPGGSYSFTVEAGNGYMNFGPPLEVTVNTLSAFELQAPASSMPEVSTDEYGTIELNWQDPADSDLMAVHVYWRKAGRSAFKQRNLPVGREHIELKGLVNSTIYEVKLAFEDAEGNISSTPLMPVTTRTGTKIMRISQSNDGWPGDSGSGEPHMSKDGKYIVFASGASNLVEHDTNFNDDVFLYDRQTEAIQLISRGAINGHSAQPRLSGDGRFVVFASTAENLIEGADISSGIYIYDRDSDNNGVFDEPEGTSIEAISGQNGAYGFPSVNHDGSKITYTVVQTDYFGSPTSETVYVYDRTSQLNIEIAKDNNAPAMSPSISGDGRYVSFITLHSLASTDTNGKADVYLYDLQNKTRKHVSNLQIAGDNIGASSSTPFMSHDGNYMVFAFQGLQPYIHHIYLYDREADSVEILSKSDTGELANGTNYAPYITANGRYVTFISLASNLVSGEASNIYLVDLQAGSLRSLHKSYEDKVLQRMSFEHRAIVNEDGTAAAFVSGHEDLIWNDAPHNDVFVQEITDETAPEWSAGSSLTLLSEGTNQIGLAWTPASHSQGVAYYKLVYGSGREVLIDGDTLEATFSGLLPDTDYSFQVFAASSSGIWVPGPSLDVRTLPAGGGNEPLAIDSARFLTPLAFKTLAITGESLSMAVEGTPASVVHAEIEYTSNGVAAQETIVLEEGNSGTYSGSFVIEEGVSSILSTRFLLEKDGESTEKFAEGLPLTVGGNVTVSFDTDTPELLEGSYASIYSQESKTVAGKKLAGGDAITFRGLPESDDYSLRLISRDGIPLLPGGQYTDVTAVSGETRQAVLTPLFPAAVNVKIVDQHGENVPYAKVRLSNAEGKILFTGNTLFDGTLPANVKGLLSRSEITVQVAETDRHTQAESVFTLDPGFNRLQVEARKRVIVTLSGEVRDADGRTVEGAVVTASQFINNKTVVGRAITDADGAYSMRVYTGSATLQAGFIRYSSSPAEEIEISESAANQFNLALDKAIETVVFVNLYTKYIDGEWTGPHEMDWRTTVHYHLHTTHRRLSSASPYVMQAKPGETVRFCVDGYESGLPRACAETVINEQNRGTVELRLQELGVGVAGQLDSSAGLGRVQAKLYRVHDDGRRTQVASRLTTSSFLLKVKEPGAYEVELIAESGHYARKAVILTESAMTELGAVAMLPSGPFRQAEYTAVSFLTSEAVPGGTVTVHSRYQNSGTEDAEQVKLLLEIPNGTSLVPNSAVWNGEEIPAVLQDGRLVVDVGGVPALANGFVQYALTIHSEYSENYLSVSQLIDYVPSGSQEIVHEHLGESSLAIADVTMEAPEVTGRSKFTVSGLAPIGSTVRVYDRELLLGEAQAAESGRWFLTVDLQVEGTESDHWLRAEAIRGDEHWMTEDSVVRYNGNHPEMVEVSMRQTDGRTVTFDPAQGVARFPYVYAVGMPFYFTIKFNRPDQVENVRVWVGSSFAAAYPDINGDFTAIVAAGKVGAISITYDKLQTHTGLGDAIPTSEELRSQLPEEMQHFVTISKQINRNEANNSFAASTSNSIPFRGGELVANVSLSMQRTNQFVPSQEDLERSAATGLSGYGLESDTKVRTNEIGISVSAYFPESMLEDASAGAIAQLLMEQADPGFELMAAVGLTKEKPPEVQIASIGGAINYVKVAFQGAMKWQGAGNMWTGIDSAYSLFDGMGVNGVFKDLENIVDKAAENCDPATFFMIRRKADNLAEMAFGYEILKYLMMVVGVVWAPATFGLGTIAMFVAQNAIGKLMDAFVESEVDKLRNLLHEKCKPSKTADPSWIYDPSGYVYEVDPSNRIEGVKATVFYKDEQSGEWIEWDAQWYLQQNPLYTDAEGRYAWDVPEGLWKVVFEKDGFITAESAELRVLPPHFDVNIPMNSLLPAGITQLHPVPGGQGVELVFDRHVWEDTVNAYTITIKAKDSGEEAEGTWGAVDAVQYNGKTVSKHYRFTPFAPLQIEGGYVLEADEVIQTYNGVPMSQTYSGEFIAAQNDVSAPGPVLDVKVHGDQDTLTLMWQDPSDLDFDHVMISWKIEGSTEQPATMTVPKGKKWASINNLTPGERYEVVLYAYDSSGNASEAAASAAMNEPVVRADFSTPLPVSELSVTEQGEVVLTWVDSPDEDVDHIRVTWTPEGSETGQSAAVALGVHRFVPAGLAANTLYDFTVAAVDQAGNMSPGRTVSRLTPAAPGGGGGHYTPPLPPSTDNTDDSDDSANDDPNEAKVTIDGSGDVYRLFKGELVLTVPEGAFEGPAELMVVRESFGWKLPGNEWSAQSSYVYRITEKDGKTPSKPMMVDLQYAGEENVDPRTFGIYRSESSALQYVGGVVRIDESRIYVETMELGAYSVLRFAKTFSDLIGHWSRSDVEALASRHIVSGVSPSKFVPERSITRAEFAKLLVNILGEMSSEPAKEITFKDVPSDEWYYEAVTQAAALGLVTGYDSRFRPDDSITREEAAVILERFTKLMGAELPASELDLQTYDDSGVVSGWALEAVRLAVERGWIRGTGAQILDPLGITTRAQAAVMILRVLGTLEHVTE